MTGFCFPSAGLLSPKLPYLEDENWQEELPYSTSLLGSPTPLLMSETVS